MKILSPADVAEIKVLLSCNIANKTIEYSLNISYGIKDCSDLITAIDKSSAYLWALNSECILTESFLCKIAEYVNKFNFKIVECNPNITCVQSREVNCGISLSEETEDSCTLPNNTIQIIL